MASLVRSIILNASAHPALHLLQKWNRYWIFLLSISFLARFLRFLRFQIISIPLQKWKFRIILRIRLLIYHQTSAQLASRRLNIIVRFEKSRSVICIASSSSLLWPILMMILEQLVFFFFKELFWNILFASSFCIVHSSHVLWQLEATFYEAYHKIIDWVSNK